MFDINGGEMVVIAIIALIVLGPQRLPELARKAGEWTRTMRAIALDFRQGLEREVGTIENPIRQIRDDITRPLNQVRDELRGVGGELRNAAQDVDRGLSWNGPAPSAGPSPTDAADDLARINAGEDLVGPEVAPPGEDADPPGQGQDELAEKSDEERL